MATHANRGHSRFAPSSAERWLNCPGSVKLSESAPPKVDTDASKQGTAAHECLEYLVERFANIPAAARVDRWPREMIEYGIQSAQTIMELRPSPSAELLIEQRVVYSEPEKMWGTLDYAWVEDWGELVVIDYKYGKGLVLPADMNTGKKNPQLMYYASALIKRLGDDFETVTLAIIQPRVTAGATIVSTSIDEIREFDSEVEKAVKLAKQKSPPLHAGPWCKYCPASVLCPEISKGAMEDANILFDFEESTVLAMPEVRGLDAATVGRMLQAADVLEIWIKAVREYAYVSAQRGEKIQGYKLVPKRALRYWDDGAEQLMEKTFGKDAYSVKKVFLSPAELERAKGSIGKEFTAKHASAFSSGYTLVPETDIRPGVELGSVFDFD